MDMNTWWTFFVELPKNYPTLTGWFSSAVSAAVVLNALLSYWKRPVIRVRLDRTAGSYGSVPLIFNEGQPNREEREGRYFRLRVENAGRTTIKDCRGYLQGIRTQTTAGVSNFDSEVVPRGWANFEETKRDIPPGAHFYLDVATLILSADKKSSALYWEKIPTTLIEYLRKFSGRVTHTFEIRIDADNARQRTVPVRFTFDPGKSDLMSRVPFNTQYPGWHLRWWLRSLRSD